jgi:hypothetical protein
LAVIKRSSFFRGSGWPTPLRARLRGGVQPLARRPGRRSSASARNAATSVEDGGVPEKVLERVLYLATASLVTLGRDRRLWPLRPIRSSLITSCRLPVPYMCPPPSRRRLCRWRARAKPTGREGGPLSAALRDERGSAAGVPGRAAGGRRLRRAAREVAGGDPHGRSGTAAAAPRQPRLACRSGFRASATRGGAALGTLVVPFRSANSPGHPPSAANRRPERPRGRRAREGGGSDRRLARPRHPPPHVRAFVTSTSRSTSAST